MQIKVPSRPQPLLLGLSFVHSTDSDVSTLQLDGVCTTFISANDGANHLLNVTTNGQVVSALICWCSMGTLHGRALSEPGAGRSFHDEFLSSTFRGMTGSVRPRAAAREDYGVLGELGDPLSNAEAQRAALLSELRTRVRRQMVGMQTRQQEHRQQQREPRTRRLSSGAPAPAIGASAIGPEAETPRPHREFASSSLRAGPAQPLPRRASTPPTGLPPPHTTGPRHRGTSPHPPRAVSPALVRAASPARALRPDVSAEIKRKAERWQARPASLESRAADFRSQPKAEPLSRAQRTLSAEMAAALERKAMLSQLRRTSLTQRQGDASVRSSGGSAAEQPRTGGLAELQSSAQPAPRTSTGGVGVRAERIVALSAAKVSAIRRQLRDMRSPALAQAQREEERAGVVLGVSWLCIELLLSLCDLRARGDDIGAIVEAVVLPLTAGGADEPAGAEARHAPPVGAVDCSDSQRRAIESSGGQGGGCSLLELFIGLSHSGSPLVGRMCRFHSYAWGEPLQSTLRALRGHLVRQEERRSVYLWWDLFCQSQWHRADVQATFDRAVSQCDGLLLSIPNPARPIATGRVWVLFEVMSATVAGKPVEVLVNPLALGSGSSASVNEEDLDVSRAQATRPEDREHILSLVEQRVLGGAQALNEAVRRVVVRGFVKASMRRRAAMGAAFSQPLRQTHELSAIVSCRLADGSTIEARGLPATSGPAAHGVPLSWTSACIASPLDARLPLDKTACRGRVVLCVRGGNTFERKASIAQGAGAVGLVIVNEASSAMPTRLRIIDGATISVALIDAAEGVAMLRAGAGAQGISISIRYEHNDLGGIGIHGETIKALQNL